MVYCPFDNVPPEILSHILTLAWLSNGKDNSWSRFRFPSIPSLVNRTFNRTTISTPILWSYIRVNGASNLPHVEDRILRKSGALPLDMHLIFDEIYYKDARVMVERSILLSPSRCRTIMLSHLYHPILEVPLSANFWDHLQPLMAIEPPLQVSCFSIFNENTNTPWLGSLPPLDASLRSLTLSNCNFVWSLAFLPGTLEVLTVDDTEEVDVMDIYRCLDGPIHESLKSLSLSGFLVEHHAIPDPHIFGRLEYFELENFYFDEAVVLLSVIRAPNLHHLSLSRTYSTALIGDLAALWNDLKFPHLWKLTLRDLRVGPEELGNFFSNLPSSVKYLEIGGEHIIDLHMHPSSDSLYRQLLEIHAHRVPLHILAALVEGRCLSLQTLEARFRRASDIDQTRRREKVVAQFNILKNLVPGFKVLKEAEDPEVDETTRLDLKQVLVWIEGGL